MKRDLEDKTAEIIRKRAHRLSGHRLDDLIARIDRLNSASKGKYKYLRHYRDAAIAIQQLNRSNSTEVELPLFRQSDETRIHCLEGLAPLADQHEHERRRFHHIAQEAETGEVEEIYAFNGRSNSEESYDIQMRNIIKIDDHLDRLGTSLEELSKKARQILQIREGRGR